MTGVPLHLEGTTCQVRLFTSPLVGEAGQAPAWPGEGDILGGTYSLGPADTPSVPLRCYSPLS